MKLIVDLETNGLLQECTKVHCIGVRDISSDYHKLFIGEEGIAEFFMRLSPNEELISHNGFVFDLEVIKKIYDIDLTKTHKIHDTIILSQLFFGDLKNMDFEKFNTPKKYIGSHSLAAWGHRLGVYKGEYTGGFETYNEDMGNYCLQDTLVTKELFNYFESIKADRIEREDCIDLEYQVAIPLARQQAFGVNFDKDKAQELEGTLQAEKVKIRLELQQLFKPRIVSLGEVTPKVNRKDLGIRKGATYTRIKFEEYNPSSRKQTVDRLAKELGWEPQEFTDKGNATLDEDIIESLPFKEIEPLKNYYILDKRLGQLANGAKAWLKVVKPNNRIYGSMLQSGTVSGRSTHFGPNLSQVPANNKFYGKECRELFRVPEGKVMIGVDADALEMRTLAGFLKPLDGGKFIKTLLEGKKELGTDMHSLNARAYQVDHLESGRDCAKTAFYGCVTMDTTTLTRQGWKEFKDLKIGEEVLTYNSKLKVKEWAPILEKFYYQDAEVIEMSYSHSFNFKSTPNHRWYVNQRRQDGHRGLRTYIPEVRTTREINTESNLIINAPYNEPKSYHTNYEIIDDKWNTNWTQKILNMNHSERCAFLQGFLVADGFIKKSCKGWGWGQNEGEIAEAALTASYLCTASHVYVIDKKGCNHKMIQATLGSKSHLTGQKLIKKKIENQPVWCIKTINNSFVARQGNTITITGNSLYGCKNPKLGLILQQYGVNFQEYVENFDNEFENLKRWSEKKKTGFSDKYLECLLAGKTARERYGKKMPHLPKLIENVVAKWKERGYLIGLDGRKLYPRSEHSVFNILNQSAGAIIMKRAWIIADNKLKETLTPGKDYEFILTIHDEAQLEVVDNENVVRYTEIILRESIRDAGLYYGFPCEMTGNTQRGLNWSQTH